MHVPTLIEHKRDGGTLTSSEIEELIRGFTTGEVPDYQMSALAMAVFFQGMTEEETAALTIAMMKSGRVLQIEPIKEYSPEELSVIPTWLEESMKSRKSNSE